MGERVGIVGMGLMGQAFVHHLLASGFEVQGYDIDARSMLLCPVISEGHLLGGLQLINRLNTHRYSQADSNVASYIAERLGEFLHETRRRRSQQPPKR